MAGGLDDTWSDCSEQDEEPPEPEDSSNPRGTMTAPQVAPAATASPMPQVAAAPLVKTWWSERILEGPLKTVRAGLGPQRRPIHFGSRCTGMWSEIKCAEAPGS